MRRDHLDALERALQAADPPDAGPARERARRTVLAAHTASRSRHRARRAVPVVWVALAAVLAALFVTQRDSGPSPSRSRAACS
jgi:peptidoglycan/LPS O-acetylase OafA/YrhL